MPRLLGPLCAPHPTPTTQFRGWTVLSLEALSLGGPPVPLARTPLGEQGRLVTGTWGCAAGGNPI